jgi:hypothetical protein
MASEPEKELVVFRLRFQLLTKVGTPDGDEFAFRLVGVSRDFGALRGETVKGSLEVTKVFLSATCVPASGPLRSCPT